jgi:Arc/MetJ-type ribon-helix-helix transcriptional regulator
MEEMEEVLIPVEIPKDLFEKINERIDGIEFKSVSEYVTFVLEEVVSEDGDEEEDEAEEIYTKEDEEKIKERLKGLGYL